MNLKTKTTTRYYVTIQERELELPCKVDFSEANIQILANGHIVIGWLSHDELDNNPLDDQDGMGHIYSSSRHASKDDHREMQQALGLDEYWEKIEGAEPNPYAVLLDCYRHGGECWAVHGSPEADAFPDRRWDVGSACGVWVPDGCLVELLMELPQEQRYAKAVEYANQALEEFNAWLAGETFVVGVAVFGGDNQCVEEDNCHGHIGRKYAEKERDDWIKRLVKEYETK